MAAHAHGQHHADMRARACRWRRWWSIASRSSDCTWSKWPSCATTSRHCPWSSLHALQRCVCRRQLVRAHPYMYRMPTHREGVLSGATVCGAQYTRCVSCNAPMHARRYAPPSQLAGHSSLCGPTAVGVWHREHRQHAPPPHRLPPTCPQVVPNGTAESLASLADQEGGGRQAPPPREGCMRDWQRIGRFGQHP